MKKNNSKFAISAFATTLGAIGFILTIIALAIDISPDTGEPISAMHSMGAAWFAGMGMILILYAAFVLLLTNLHK